MTFKPDSAYARHLESFTLGLTALFALVIALATFSPETGVGGAPGQDKILHAIAFAGLVLPVAVLARQHLIWLAPLAIGYGAAIEVIQPFVGRGGEWLDLVADIAGVILGIFAGTVIRSFLRFLDRV